MEGRDGRRVSAFFSVFWISLGGALGEVFFIVYSEGREGGGERGEEGGEIGEKGIQGWREKRKTKMMEGRRRERWE